jgi:endonuclease/exonuclease/phosphatase family metal-dependent hydrolase
MAKVRVATFNCENLFARYKFDSKADPAKASRDGWTVDQSKFELLRPVEKKLTSLAILEADADVIALQEVENHEVLRRFNREHLKSLKYTHTLLVDGPDPRHIDVAVLSRAPITHARSYQHMRSGASPLFSRDCLEVDVDVSGRALTLYVNHLKSMLVKKDAANGRKITRARRLAQAKGVREIIEARFGAANTGAGRWIIAGDLNDYAAADQGTTTALGSLLDWDQAENVLDRVAEAERWTHFYDKKDAYRQLDYLLCSKAVASVAGKVGLVRKGLPTTATGVTEARFPGVTKTVAASDHCPFFVDITM